MNEAREAWDSRSSGGGALLMPTMWHEGSYVELDRCLDLLRNGGPDQLLDPATGSPEWEPGGFPVEILRSPQPRLWFHVCSRYRWGVERTILATVNPMKGPGKPPYLLPPHTELIAGGQNVGERQAVVRVYRWSEHVRPDLAAAGLDALVTLMHGGRSHEIWLPDSVYRRVMGLPHRDEIEGGVEEYAVA